MDRFEAQLCADEITTRCLNVHTECVGGERGRFFVCSLVPTNADDEVAMAVTQGGWSSLDQYEILCGIAALIRCELYPDKARQIDKAVRDCIILSTPR